MPGHGGERQSGLKEGLNMDRLLEIATESNESVDIEIGSFIFLTTLLQLMCFKGLKSIKTFWEGLENCQLCPEQVFS